MYYARGRHPWSFHTQVTEKISKSRFKPVALELMRRVQESGTPLVITDHGKPVLTLAPFPDDSGDDALLASLRGTVVRYDAPFDPAAPGEWEALGNNP